MKRNEGGQGGENDGFEVRKAYFWVHERVGALTIIAIVASIAAQGQPWAKPATPFHIWIERIQAALEPHEPNEAGKVRLAALCSPLGPPSHSTPAYLHPKENLPGGKGGINLEGKEGWEAEGRALALS